MAKDTLPAERAMALGQRVILKKPKGTSLRNNKQREMHYSFKIWDQSTWTPGDDYDGAYQNTMSNSTNFCCMTSVGCAPVSRMSFRLCVVGVRESKKVDFNGNIHFSLTDQDRYPCLVLSPHFTGDSDHLSITWAIKGNV